MEKNKVIQAHISLPEEIMRWFECNFIDIESLIVREYKETISREEKASNQRTNKE